MDEGKKRARLCGRGSSKHMLEALTCWHILSSLTLYIYIYMINRD